MAEVPMAMFYYYIITDSQLMFLEFEKDLSLESLQKGYFKKILSICLKVICYQNSKQ